MKILQVLLCAPLVCAAFQVDTEWTELMEAGRTSLTRLDFAGAAMSYQRAAGRAEKLPPEGGELVMSLNALATAHKQMKRLAEAAREYQRAIDVSANSKLRGSITYAYLLASLAAVEIERQSFERAEQMLVEAIEIDERTGPQDSVQLAIARQLLAKVMMKQTRYETADKLLNQAIKVFQRQQDAPVDLLPFAWDNLGNLRRLQGRGDDALAAFQESLTLLEGIYGRDHPALILELNNLGVEFQLLGRASEARANFERAVLLLDRNEEADPATKSQILANYAAFLKYAGDSRKADIVARRAFAIRDSLPVDVSALGPQTFRKR